MSSNGQKSNPAIRALVAKTTDDVQVEGLWYKVRHLTPSEAARLSVAVGLVVSAVQDAQAARQAAVGAAVSKSHLDPSVALVGGPVDPAGVPLAMDRAQRTHDAKASQGVAETEAADHMEVVVCNCVVAVSTTKRKWYPVKFTRNYDEQDAERGVVFLGGSLQPDSIGQLAFVAVRHYLEAADLAATFRGGPDDDGNA